MRCGILKIQLKKRLSCCENRTELVLELGYSFAVLIKDGMDESLFDDLVQRIQRKYNGIKTRFAETSKSSLGFAT